MAVWCTLRNRQTMNYELSNIDRLTRAPHITGKWAHLLILGPPGLLVARLIKSIKFMNAYFPPTATLDNAPHYNATEWLHTAASSTTIGATTIGPTTVEPQVISRRIAAAWLWCFIGFADAMQCGAPASFSKWRPPPEVVPKFCRQGERVQMANFLPFVSVTSKQHFIIYVTIIRCCLGRVAGR